MSSSSGSSSSEEAVVAARSRIEANRAEALRRRAARRKREEDESRPAQKKKSKGACRECGSSPVNAALASHFGIAVCEAHRSRDEDLVPATEAASQYLLPKATLKEMRCLDRPNPRGFATPMKLYLRRDLENASLKRFGSADKVEAERARRDAATWQRRAKRVSTLFASTRRGPLA